MKDPLVVKRNDKPIDLEGLWSPNPAFLVGSGPELEKFPLERLKERGVASMGVNNAAARAPVKAWCFGDPQNKFHQGLYLDPTVMTFAPQPKLKRMILMKLDGRFHRTEVRVRQTPNVFSFNRGMMFQPKTFFETEWAQWGKGKHQPEGTAHAGCLATLFVGFRLLHYLGVRRVYLIGVDHTSNRRRYKKEQAAFKRLLPVFERVGFEVINCNRRSGCRVFPFADFHEAVDDCKGSVPSEPLDVEGWYSKKEVQAECKSSLVMVPKHFSRCIDTP